MLTRRAGSAKDYIPDTAPAPAIKLGAVDIVPTELHYWKGPRGVKDLCAVCRTFGLGLGVTLDEDKMAKYERYYAEKGDYYARFHQDPRRPEWFPTVGGT